MFALQKTGPGACQYANLTCHNCGNVGQVASVLRSEPSEKSNYIRRGRTAMRNHQNSSRRRPKKAGLSVPDHRRDNPDDQYSHEEPATYNVWQLNTVHVPSFMVNPQNSYQAIDMYWDTGAGVSLMQARLLWETFTEWTILSFDVLMRGYSRQLAPVPDVLRS